MGKSFPSALIPLSSPSAQGVAPEWKDAFISKQVFEMNLTLLKEFWSVVRVLSGQKKPNALRRCAGLQEGLNTEGKK